MTKTNACFAACVLMILTGCADSVFKFEAEEFSGRADISDNMGWMIADGDTFQIIEGKKGGSSVLTRSRGAQGVGFIAFIGGRTGVLPDDNRYAGRTVDYNVEIKMPGYYRLYVRWCGTNGSSDSFYAMVLDNEGRPARGPACVLFFSDPAKHGKWVWGSTGCAESADIDMKNTVKAEWNITSPGVYTIRLASREPNTAIDALVFQHSLFPPPE